MRKNYRKKKSDFVVFNFKYNKHYSLMRFMVIIFAVLGSIAFLLIEPYFPYFIEENFPGIKQDERLVAILFSGGTIAATISWWPSYFFNRKRIKADNPGFPWKFFLEVHSVFVFLVFMLLLEA